MSFGFSVSDFITLADKAWEVYRKCNDAAQQYQQLSHYVEVPAHVLKEVCTFVEAGDIPDSEPKVASLTSARQTCSTTLGEVEDFLKKHSKMGGKSKRLIDTIKFISGDVKELQAKLRISTELLQLSLTSLTSLSVVQIRSSLKEIVQEYRTGAHEPTVLSSLIQSHDYYSQADNDELKEEMYDQVVADLQGRDVHPDCISLHDGFIRQWLQDMTILEQESLPLGDAVSHTPSPLEIDAITQHVPDSASVNFVESQCQTTTTLMHPDEDNALNPTPHDQPDSELVRQTLGTLLEADPYSPYRLETAGPRIQRAYYRLDYTQRGYLTRSEVVKAFREALDYAGIAAEKIGVWDLPAVIAQMDANHDGRFEEEDFTKATHQIVHMAFEAKEEQLVEALALCGSEARSSLNQRRQNIIPPFGWFKSTAGSTLPYRDSLTGQDWPFPPELKDRTFSIMAVDADWCVERINILQEKWLAIVPRALRSLFLEDFNTVRTVALEYTLFEKSGLPDELSDLDIFLASYHIAHKLQNGPLPEKLSAVAGGLVIAQDYSYELLSKVLAFTQILNEALDFKPTVQRFTDMKSAWRKSQVSAASRLIEQSSKQWREIVVQWVNMNRTLDMRELRSFQDEAMLLIRDGLRRRLDQVKLVTEVKQICVSGFKPKSRWYSGSKRVSSTLVTHNPPQSIDASPWFSENKECTYEWKFGYKKIYLCRQSRLELKIFHTHVYDPKGGDPEVVVGIDLGEVIDAQHWPANDELEIKLPTTDINKVDAVTLSLSTPNSAEFWRNATFQILSDMADLAYNQRG